MSEQTIRVRELDTFVEDEREVKAALVHARRFAKPQPFADREEAGEAADAIKVLNGARKAAEARKLETTAEWRANTAAVNAEYKELLSTVGVAESVLKKKGLAFKREEQAKIDAERRAEQERLDREAEQKAAESQAAAELAAEEPDNPEAKEFAGEAFQEAAKAAVAIAPAPMPAPKNLRGDYGALGSYTVWKHEVTDASLLPPEHTIPNEKSLKAAVKAEAAVAKAQGRPFNLEIPGTRIYADEIAVSR
jgi:hypothetical protein